MVKTTAPLKSVPLRPIASPMRPAASDVTAAYQSGIRSWSVPASRSKGSLNAPISNTETIKPNSPAPGSWKYFLKYGPVMIPDITLL